MKRIGVVGVVGGWSSERLADAVERKTGHRLLLEADQLRFDLGSGRFALAGRELTGLDALIIKKIGSQYSPHHCDRLRILGSAAEQGLSIFSRPDRILRAYDRLTCTLELRRGAIPMPPTILTEDPTEASRAVTQFGRAILKPLFTSKARGMRLLQAGDGVAEQLKAFRASGHALFYIQKFLDLPGRDYGVTFLGGRYLGTYARVLRPGSWSTTTNQGGRYEPCEPSRAVAEVANKAQALFGLDFTCVDVAETAEGPVVFEVSPFGGFRGLWQACGIDAAPLYVEHVLSRIGHE